MRLRKLAEGQKFPFRAICITAEFPDLILFVGEKKALIRTSGQEMLVDADSEHWVLWTEPRLKQKIFAYICMDQSSQKEGGVMFLPHEMEPAPKWIRANWLDGVIEYKP